MRTVRTAPHEWQAHYLYPDGLDGYFAASRVVSDSGGSRKAPFHFDGQPCLANLFYQDSGLRPPEGGVTPDGTRVEFDTLREFRIDVTVDDEVGEKKAQFLIQPRWRGLQSKKGNDVARPVWDVGDAINVFCQGANFDHDDYPRLLEQAAAALGINPSYFDRERIHDYSTVVDAAAYVRVDRARSGRLHARDGPLARMGHLLESDREGYRKIVQDDTEAKGYYHAVTLGSGRVREAFRDHRLPKEIKHYLPREAESFSEEHPLYHPKLEAAYERKRWDRSLHPVDDVDELRDELEEAVLSTLHEADLPIRPQDGEESVFVPDAYFDADEHDGGTEALPLRLERIEQDDQNVVVRHLKDGLSPVEWDSLDKLVSDGGEVSPAEIADENGWHPDSVRRALRRIDDMVERSYGTVSLRSHHVAEMVHKAVVEAETNVKNAVEAGAKALEAAEQGLAEAEEELIAWCAAHGIHVSRRDARVVVKMGEIGDQDWFDVFRQLRERWALANRDVGRLRHAIIKFRKNGQGSVVPLKGERDLRRKRKGTAIG